MRRPRTNHNGGRRRGSSLGLHAIVRIDFLSGLRIDFDIHRLKLTVFILRNLDIHTVTQTQLCRLYSFVRDLDGEDSRILRLHIKRLRLQHPDHAFEGLVSRRGI